MPLSDADRAFMSYDWRWLENADAALKARHPTAREAEYGTAFMTSAGATAALNIILPLTDGKARLIVATIDGIPNGSFKKRPPTVRVFHSRFAGDPVNGRLMMVEQMNVDYYLKRTTLHLVG
jgi:hypothetical protein